MSETALDLYEANSTMFLGSTLSDLVRFDSPEGDEIEINGERIPLLSTNFNLSVVQPGSVQSDPDLRQHVGKIRLKFGESAKEDEFLDSVDLLPISVISYGFTKFGEFGKNKDNAVLCQSLNGLVPSQKYLETAPSTKCAELTRVNGELRLTPVCPDAVWGDDKPACSQNVRVAFLMLDGCIPLYMQLHGVGMSSFNAFRRQMKKAANVARIRKRNLGRYIIHLSTEDKGTYIVPVFSFVEAPEKYGDMQPYYSVARYFRDTMFSHAKSKQQQAGSETVEDITIDGGGEDYDL